MKFGQYLQAQARPEWGDHYVDYRALKKLIRDSVREDASAIGSPRSASLSVARTSRLAAEEQFQLRLDDEMEKVGDFTQGVVVQLRSKLKTLAARLSRGTDPLTILHGVRQVDAELLALEKYTVLNYMACHKILKKHDRLRPRHASQQFMLHHLHRKPWVNGYFRDLLPQVSALYTRLKAHPESSSKLAPATPPASPGYVYHTRSFWVTAEDLPVVRHHINQNVPIHAPPGETPQSDVEQHAMYLDNSLMELYHNRLYDRPNATTLKLAWQGDRAPEWVDLERSTYKESWKREPPCLESIPLKLSELHNFISGSYSYVSALDDLEEGGRGVSDAHQCYCYQKLHTSIQAMVNAKQLLPVVRVRSYRTEFQAADEARVRATLDGELMYCPEEELGGQVVEQLALSWTEGSGDSSCNTPLRPSSYWRTLPYALLQVTMFLREGEEEPRWLQDLWEAGYLSEIFEWSAFLHAAAELYPHTLRALPYWIDDPGLRAARDRQAARFAAARAAMAAAATPASPPRLARTSRGSDASGADGGGWVRRGSFRDLWSFGSGSGLTAAAAAAAAATPPRSPQPHPTSSSALRHARTASGGGAASGHDAGGGGGIAGAATQLLQRISSRGKDRDGGGGSGAATPPKPGGPLRPRRPLRIANYEPTAFLQNERVFHSWLMMAIQTAGIATAMLGFGATAYKDPLWDRQPIRLVTAISLILLPISVIMCAYAVAIFAWRRRCIRLNHWERFHDQLGPPLLALVVAVAMAVVMVLSIADWWQTHQTHKQHKHRRSPAHRSPALPFVGPQPRLPPT